MQLTGTFARIATVFRPTRPTSAPLPALRRRAQGTIDRSDPRKRRMVVTLDAETFEHVGDAAAAAGISISEALRQLIRRGLDATPKREA